MKVKVRHKSVVDEATARIKSQQREVENNIRKLNSHISQAINYAYSYVESQSRGENGEVTIPGSFNFIESVYLDKYDKYHNLNIQDIMHSIFTLEYGFFYSILNRQDTYEFYEFYKTKNGKTFEIRACVSKIRLEPARPAERVLIIYFREVFTDDE